MQDQRITRNLVFAQSRWQEKPNLCMIAAGDHDRKCANLWHCNGSNTFSQTSIILHMVDELDWTFQIRWNYSVDCATRNARPQTIDDHQTKSSGSKGDGVVLTGLA